MKWSDINDIAIELEDAHPDAPELIEDPIRDRIDLGPPEEQDDPCEDHIQSGNEYQPQIQVRIQHGAEPRQGRSRFGIGGRFVLIR